VWSATVTAAPAGLAKVRAVTARLPRDQRCDARDNRGRILDAARTVFVTTGLDVPIREIARRAEVGPATVYRHFPTKQVLVAEAFTEQARAWRSTVDEALTDPDPWHGFCLAVAKLCELQARDHGFTVAVKSTFPRALDFVAMRASSLRAAAELVRRAKDTGRLRADVVLDDLILMIMANTGIHASTPAARVAASQRFAVLMIQAFQASPAGAQPLAQVHPRPPAPPPDRGRIVRVSRGTSPGQDPSRGR
jgi:AcrR family transcriptional regulator